jgi:hypothetical protein
LLAGIRDLLALQNHLPAIAETKHDMNRTIISDSRAPISRSEVGRPDKATQNNARPTRFLEQAKERAACR